MSTQNAGGGGGYKATLDDCRALYTYFDNPVRPHEFTVYECDASTLAESILLECVTIAVETVLLMRGERDL